MKGIMLSIFLGLVAIATITQAEPVRLTDDGLDKVSAGAGARYDAAQRIDATLTVDDEHAADINLKVSAKAAAAPVITPN